MKIFGFNITRKEEKRTIPSLGSDFYSAWGLPQSSDFASQIKMFKSWVYTCAARNARSVAAVPLRLYATKGKNEKLLFNSKSISSQVRKYLQSNSGLMNYLAKGIETVEVLEHPFIDLMKNVNNFNNQFDTQELTQLFMELTGNTYWYVTKNNWNIPMALWIIPPQYMSIIPDKKEYIKGYLYQRGMEKIPYEENEIIHFKFANPDDLSYGMGPAAAIWDAHKFNVDIRTFENSLLENRGIPEGGLETDNRVSDVEFERIKNDWAETHRGKAKVGKTAFLDKGIHYKPYGVAPKDITYPLGQKRAIEEIAAAFGVPMSKLTTESVNLANAAAGEVQYQRDTIVPRLRILEQKINEKLLPMFDSRLFVAYDDPVPENRTLQLEETKAYLQTGVTVINEERARIGKEPVPWGDLPLLPMNLVPHGRLSVKDVNEFSDIVLQKIKQGIN